MEKDNTDISASKNKLNLALAQLKQIIEQNVQLRTSKLEKDLQMRISVLEKENKILKEKQTKLNEINQNSLKIIESSISTLEKFIEDYSANSNM